MFHGVTFLFLCHSFILWVTKAGWNPEKGKWFLGRIPFIGVTDKWRPRIGTYDVRWSLNDILDHLTNTYFSFFYYGQMWRSFMFCWPYKRIEKEVLRLCVLTNVSWNDCTSCTATRTFVLMHTQSLAVSLFLFSYWPVKY